jgi:flagellin
MTVISTNISAQYAQDALAMNQKSMNSAMQQLATGNRINAAKDDAAGLSIAQNMTSQIRGLNQAVRNASDGINLLQTADGGLVETSNMLQRMRELAVQSSNGTNSASQRGYLNNEFKSLQDEITRVGNNTTWNNMNLYGSVAASPNVFVFQAGTASGTTIGISIAAMNASALLVDASVAVISTFTGAQAAITSVDSAIEVVNNARSSMGAIMAQLSYSADNMTNISTNLSVSRSAITDTDYATASSQLSRAQIVQQAATAMLAQANQQPKMVLDLLK